jgi:hypothetical protein
MYRPKRLEPKIRLLFEGLAVGSVIPVSVFFTHIQAYFSAITSFLSHWNAITSLYDSIPSDSPEALLAWARNPSATSQLTEAVFQELNIGEKMNGEDFLSFNRCLFNVPDNMEIPEELLYLMELPSEITTNGIIDGVEESVLGDIKCANFSVYKTIAKLSPQRLTALSIEEYRFKRIAKDQFPSLSLSELITTGPLQVIWSAPMRAVSGRKR